MAFPLFLIPLAIEAGRAISSGAKAKKELGISNSADAQIPLNDPVQQSFLGRMERQERQYRGMTDPSSALASRLAQQSGAQTQANLLRGGGPGMIQNMLSSQNITQRNLAGIGAQASVAADNMLGQQGQLINMMASRRYDRQRYRRDLALMRSTQAETDKNASIGAMTAMIPEIGGGGNLKIGTGINREARTGYRNGPEMQVLQPIAPQQIQPPSLPPMTPVGYGQ